MIICIYIHIHICIYIYIYIYIYIFIPMSVRRYRAIEIPQSCVALCTDTPRCARFTHMALAGGHSVVWPGVVSVSWSAAWLVARWASGPFIALERRGMRRGVCCADESLFIGGNWRRSGRGGRGRRITVVSFRDRLQERRLRRPRLPGAGRAVAALFVF
jgi:hypothetical protein